MMTCASLLNGSIRVSLTTALPQGESGICQGFDSIFQVHKGWEGSFSESKNLLPPLKKKNPPFSEPILLIFGSVSCSIWKPYCSVSKETANKQGLWYLLFWKSQARPIAEALCSGSQKHLLSFQSWNIFLFDFLLPSPSHPHKHLCVGEGAAEGMGGGRGVLNYISRAEWKLNSSISR